MPCFHRFAPSRRKAYVMPFTVAGLLSLSLLVCASCSRSEGGAVSVLPGGAVQTDSQVITDFSQPFLFTYLSWENKVVTQNGIALVRGEGVTPKGGGGANVALDLSASANLCPVMRLKVGAGNTLKTLKMTLADDSVSAASDAEKRSTTFEYLLPDKPTEGFVTIYPKGGATLNRPNTTGALGKANPAKIRQWQILGDWGGDGAVDIEIDTVTLAQPDAASKAAQVESENQAIAAQQKAAADRAEENAKYGKRHRKLAPCRGSLPRRARYYRRRNPSGQSGYHALRAVCEASRRRNPQRR